VPNLQTLNLQYNQLSSINFLCSDSIGNCPFPNLQFIDISHNNLIASICQIYSPLIYLDLSYNKLHGPIDNVEQLSYLVTINLNSNNLDGTIPSFPNLNNLAKLYLNSNKFSGTIPSMLPWTLTTLELANNALNGTIPQQLGILALKSINLFNTTLCGCFPSQWINNEWESCNIVGFPHNCNCTLKNCDTNGCDLYNTISCDGEPCNNNQCSTGRVCIPDNLGYGYYCSSNCSLLYVPSPNSPFTCDVDPKVVLGLEISLPFLFVLTVISSLCAIFPRKTTPYQNYDPINSI